MAKQFSGLKPLWRIEAKCGLKGWRFDKSKHDAGSDWVTFEFKHGRKTFVVVYSSFNGKFIIKQGKKLITESSTEMDGTPRGMTRFCRFCMWRRRKTKRRNKHRTT